MMGLMSDIKADTQKLKQDLNKNSRAARQERPKTAPTAQYPTRIRN